MCDVAVELILADTRFTPCELIHYADADKRGLDEAISSAEVLVTVPHATARVPAELADYLAPGSTMRILSDFSDRAAGALAREWAAIDRRIVVVENPHPRLVRDPDRPQPTDLEHALRTAFARIDAAGSGRSADFASLANLADFTDFVDFAGVDAVRPVNFAGIPVLRRPGDDIGWKEMAAAFDRVAELGLAVYERTRDDLADRMIEARLRLAGETGRPQQLFVLSLHDTMNRLAHPDGALAEPRALEDRLPDVVSLSNCGDLNGEPRGDEPVTLRPDLLRRLAEAHQDGFEVAECPEAVALNRRDHGSWEITGLARRFREVASQAATARVTLGVIHAEFLREFLLGEQAAAQVMRPGVDWPEPPRVWTELLAGSLRASWELFLTGGAAES